MSGFPMLEGSPTFIVRSLVAFFRQEIHLDVQVHKSKELIEHIVLTTKLLFGWDRSGVDESLCWIHFLTDRLYWFIQESCTRADKPWPCKGTWCAAFA